MKFKAKFATGIFVFTAIFGAPLLTYAAPSGIPTAKQAEKAKVVDSKNKKLGFISANDHLTFKADGRYFQALVSKESLTATPESRLLFESTGCTGSAYLNYYSENGLIIYEVAFLKHNVDGYEVYMHDLNIPFDPESSPSVNINSVLYSDGSCNEESSSISSVRRAKVVAKLPFTPPFSLK
jgi:hypothetical protein